MIEVLHPLDRRKLRALAEALCDGDADRQDMAALLAEIMVCVSPDCSAAGADEVLARLLLMADGRLGAEATAEAVLVEIETERGRR